MENCENIPDEMRTKCQRYSRIVGYYRPVSQWNEGKQAEWKDRKAFQVRNPATSIK